MLINNNQLHGETLPSKKIHNGEKNINQVFSKPKIKFYCMYLILNVKISIIVYIASVSGRASVTILEVAGFFFNHNVKGYHKQTVYLLNFNILIFGN